MKPERSIVAVFASLTVLFMAAISAAQEPATEKPETVAMPQAISAEKLIELIYLSRTETWSPSDPEKRRGVLVVIRLGRGAFSTEEFTLTYKTGETVVRGKTVDLTEKAFCRGYRIGRGWAITGEEGKGFKLFTGNPTTDIEFLFEIPKSISSVTLLYKGNVMGEPVQVKD